MVHLSPRVVQGDPSRVARLAASMIIVVACIHHASFLAFQMRQIPAVVKNFADLTRQCESIDVRLMHRPSCSWVQKSNCMRMYNPAAGSIHVPRSKKFLLRALSASTCAGTEVWKRLTRTAGKLAMSWRTKQSQGEVQKCLKVLALCDEALGQDCDLSLLPHFYRALTHSLLQHEMLLMT